MTSPQLISYSTVIAEDISSKVSNRQGYPLSLLLFNTILEVLATAVRPEKDRDQGEIGGGSEMIRISVIK